MVGRSIRGILFRRKSLRISGTAFLSRPPRFGGFSFVPTPRVKLAKMTISRNHWPYLALAIGIIGLGFSGIFVRWANAPGPVAGFYRMATATIVLAYPFWRRVQGKSLNRRGIGLAIFAGLLFAGDMAMWATGVTLSGATIPTLLGNTASVWVGLGALIFFRERLRGSFWFGLGLALVGAMIILRLNPFDAIHLDLGAALGLAAGVFYAGYFLVTQKGRQRLDVLSYFWIAAFSSSVALLVIVLISGQSLTGYPSQTYLSFLGLGLVSQVAGWLTINYAQGHLPATIVSPTMLGQPVVTAILAAVLLGESLTFSQFVGGIAVLAGVYLAHRSRNGMENDAAERGLPRGTGRGQGERI